MKVLTEKRKLLRVIFSLRGQRRLHSLNSRRSLSLQTMYNSKYKFYAHIAKNHNIQAIHCSLPNFLFKRLSF